MKFKSRRGSSLIFLGFSVIAFILTYGLMFYLVPIVLGVFWSTLGDIPIADPDWQTTSDETQEVLQWLIPLVPTIGIFILIIKVFMSASARGRD